MNFKTIFLLGMSNFIFCASNAQSAPNDMPVIVPPSPEVASLAKIANLSAGLHTGAANVNIPLFNITAGTINLPVSLAYSTNGIRVNDIASRVGLGWNLVAGGVITRTVHDEADGAPGVIWKDPPASFNPQPGNSELIDYLGYANQDNYDTEKDEYSFSINGLSGKFFMDNYGVPKLMDHNNLKIEIIGTGFLLTDAQGIKYYFGGGTGKTYEEWTHGQTTNGNNRWDKFVQTGWFIRKIETPENNWINFYYNGFGAPIQTIQGPSQSMILSPFGTNEGTLVCTQSNPCIGRWKAPMMNEVHYDTRYLTQIESSTGMQIYFVHQSRGDLGGDNRITDMWAQHTVGGTAKIIKKFHLEYDDYANGDKNMRFYLKKIYNYSTKLIGTPPAPDETLVHEFEYNDRSMPVQTSYSQDYFGYYNGKYNVGFAPKLTNAWMYENGDLGADRTPDVNFMQKAVLKKVTFPTGGFEEFTYEPHTIAEQAYDSVFTTSLLTGNGLSSPVSPNIKTATFTTNANPFIKIRLITSNNAPYTPYTFPDAHSLIIFAIRRTSDNMQIGPTLKFNAYVDVSMNYSTYFLEPNTQYTAEMQVFHQATHGEVRVDYNPALSPYWDNKIGCGLRVNNIRSYDPVTKKETRKYYKYTSLEDLSKSSGVGMLVTDYSGNYAGGGMCVGANGFGIQMQCNSLVQLSSSSISGVFLFGGSSVAYANVIESDDINFANGGIQHTFFTEYNSNRPHVKLGVMMPGSIFNIGNDMNGVETQTLFFKKQGPLFKTLKKVEHTYSVDNRVFTEVKSYINRKKWDPPSGIPINEQVLPYDVGEYKYTSTWYHLDATKTTEYDQDGLNPMVNISNFEYNNTQHTLPGKTTTTDSRLQPIVQETKYPVDYNTAPYTDMVNKHIISPVIETRTYKNAQLLSTVKTDYADWGGTGTVFRPAFVKMAKGLATLENRLHYYGYENNGNVVEVAKEDGLRVSYLWDYNKVFPVAEVKNSAAADIGFTSFETDDRGNWAVQGTLQPAGSTDFINYWKLYPQEGFTGNVSFGGRITKTVNPENMYIITVWSKTGNVPLVNGLPGTLVHTKNNWNLYHWKGFYRSLVTLQGNQFDEARIYPYDAMMTTYTYDPYIGITSVSDAASNVQFYEYDGLNRLLRTRDVERNIVKQYEYKYNQAIAPCANTTPNWQLTGRSQCMVNSNNNYTGVKQAEERDENNCSLTYLQTRWNIIPTPAGDCVNIPGCSGPSKRIVNGVCETGVKTLVSSYKLGTQWQCTYKYVWSDGFSGTSFLETNTHGCIIELVDL